MPFDQKTRNLRFSLEIFTSERSERADRFPISVSYSVAYRGSSDWGGGGGGRRDLREQRDPGGEGSRGGITPPPFVTPLAHDYSKP